MCGRTGPLLLKRRNDSMQPSDVFHNIKTSPNGKVATLHHNWNQIKILVSHKVSGYILNIVLYPGSYIRIRLSWSEGIFFFENVPERSRIPYL